MSVDGDSPTPRRDNMDRRIDNPGLLIAVSLALVVMVAGACDAENDEADGDHSEDEEFHSPYFIDGDGDLYFDTISFTDVGIKIDESEPADQLVLEAITEALAWELAQRGSLDYDTRVEYDESLKDPANHMHCDREHLYVALWRGYEPDRWGYSLWSGCHEQQKFEWEELEDRDDREEVDTVTWVEPVAEDIADSVVEAHEEECFSRSC